MYSDYSHFRLEDSDDLKKYYDATFMTASGPISFWQYAEKLYSKISIMVPGESFKVKDMVSDENAEVFIKILCSFIIGGQAPDFRFNENYTVFRRCELMKEMKERNIRPNRNDI